MLYKKLVSIVTPCYNGENYISRLLNSILSQDYPKIETIIVDDGSTDNSATIIQNYVKLFNQKGYSLIYLYQKNSGQSSAINTALSKVSGSYLVWPDSDDYYNTSDAITQLVTLLESASSQYAAVRCGYKLIDEHSNAIIDTIIGSSNVSTSKLFNDCIFQKGDFYFCSGAYLIKTDTLFENTNLPIYIEKNAGQNWQLLLPIFAKYKCLNLDRAIYSVVKRAQSHSRGAYLGYHQESIRLSSYERTLHYTIKNIKSLSITEKNKYQQLIHQHYTQLFLNLSYNHNQTTEYQKLYIHRKHSIWSISLITNFIKYISSFVPFGWDILRKLKS